MRRTILILTVVALMVVLMATTVSPTFATQPDQDWKPWGHGADGDVDGFGQPCCNAWKDQDGAKGYKQGHEDDKWGHGA